MYVCNYSSPLGGMTLASDGNALTGLWFDGQKYFGDTLNGACEHRDLPVFAQAKAWLDEYFQGKEPHFAPPLAPDGSPFRREVWAELLKIPYASTVTYGQIAREFSQRRGRTVSAQAVGGAVGHNPISLIIPCHRVVGSNGSYTGYAGGIDTKVRLLRLEGADVSRLFAPGRGATL